MSVESGWQYHSQVVPGRVLYLLSNGKLTATDLLLCCVINSLVKPQADEEGVGCYATNKYLARAVKVGPHYVSSRLQLLEDEGLLLRFTVGEQRYLEMDWSRTAEERQALRGEYGKQCRKAYSRLIKHLEAKGVTENCNPPLQKTVTPPLQKTVTIINNVKIEGGVSEKGRVLAPAPIPSSNGSLKTCKRTGLFTKKKAEYPLVTDEHRIAAKKLYQALRSNKRYVTLWNLDKWADIYRRIKDDDKEALLNWYCLHCSIEDEARYGTPAIGSMSQFAKQRNWIRGRMRLAIKNGESVELVEDTSSTNRLLYINEHTPRGCTPGKFKANCGTPGCKRSLAREFDDEVSMVAKAREVGWLVEDGNDGVRFTCTKCQQKDDE